MKKLLFILLLLPQLTRAQIIKTIAGNGTAMSSGNGGQATAAGLYGPNGLAYDHSGNLYITEFYNNTVRKVSPAGIITTIAGTGTAGYTGDGGQATNAKLNGPIKITVDNVDNLYFADLYNNCVRKITPSGTITTVAGNGFAGYTGNGGQATAATLFRPTGVTFDALGNLYISDYDNNVIRKVSGSGIISTVAGTGASGSSGDGGPATSAQLYQPWGVNFDASGNMYISDLANQKIRKVSSAGIITTFAGTGSAGFSGDGGQATAATLDQPSAVTFDSAGNMYIADELNNRVRKVSTSGIITTYAGDGIAGFAGDNGPATAAEINSTNDIIMNPSGHLIICDNTNDRIRIVTVDSCFNFITSEPVNDTVIEGGIAKYSVTTTAPTPSYQWQENPGTGFVNIAALWPYSGVNTDTLTIQYAGIDLNNTHYRCVITSGDFCTDTSSQAILTVHDHAGIAQVLPGQLTVYPNPSHDEITLQLSGTDNTGTLQMFNEIGQLVLTQKIDNNISQVSLVNLLPGMYLLKFDSEGGSLTEKIFKISPER